MLLYYQSSIIWSVHTMVNTKSFHTIPGVLFLLLLGIFARLFNSVLPVDNHLVIAIIIGVFMANTIGIPKFAESGVKTYSHWLEAGIVFMGVTIALDQVASAGSIVLLIVCFSVCLTIIVVETLSRFIFDISEKIGSLLAAGSSICGVSAVAAVAGTIRPTKQQVAYAAGTIVLFDAISLVIYPLVGRLIGLSDTVFGIWVGVTMFSTGPVAAAGFTYSQAAGEWAVLIKIVRNTLIGVVAIGYATYYMRKKQTAGEVGNKLVYIWKSFPKFIIGFVVLVILANLGVFSQDQISSFANASNWFFLIAFVGLGLSINVRELKRTGIEPVAAVMLSMIVVSSIVLLFLFVIFD